MASLSDIIKNKASNSSRLDIVLDSGLLFPEGETNLTDYQVWSYTKSSYNNTNEICVDWVAPAAGLAVIEVWGASGSGGKMCCCGSGIPGNPGAYARKVVQVSSGDTVTGSLGSSCGNASSLCYRGRSEQSGVCYSTSSGSGCLCAEGGFGGFARCNDGSTAMYCCLRACNFCATQQGSAGCGTICNYGGPASAVEAQAYGGDINLNGGISRTCFACCNPCRPDAYTFTAAISPGIFSKGTTYVGTKGSKSTYTSRGFEIEQPYLIAIGQAARSLGNPPKITDCRDSYNWCACYDYMGCQYVLPYGIPGLSANPCSSVRSGGLRGGPGAIKIKFIGT